MILHPGKQRLSIQFLISFLLIVALSVFCFAFSGFIDYKITALILLLAVSLLASLYSIKPVIMSAVLSAFIWDYFFIPPRFTITIGSLEDRILLLMYFVISLVSAILTYKIRMYEKQMLLKEEKEKTILLYNTILNSLSHELRTPLSTIIGTTDALKENDSNLSGEQKSDLLSEISIASLQLNQQVENLLNMSRLETGFIRLKKDWCDISELIYHTISKLNLQEHAVNVEIDPEIALVKLDYGAMETVIFNLLSNAVNYTPAGTAINIDIHFNKSSFGHLDDINHDLEAIVDREEMVLHIKISDEGSGFPENEIKLVFDKFYRLKNAKAGGTGLGLSIVKGFVEAHGGQISLMNNLTKGATFELAIPVETTHINKLKNE